MSCNPLYSFSGKHIRDRIKTRFLIVQSKLFFCGSICKKSTTLLWDKIDQESYRNFPKFSDRQVWANSADPDQTAPRLFAIACITLRKRHLVTFKVITLNFWVSEILGFLRYSKIRII